MTIRTTAFSFICANADYRDGMVGLAADGKAVDLAWSAGANGACGPNKLFLRRATDGVERGSQLLPDDGAGSLGWPEVAVRGNSVLLLISPQAPGQRLLHSVDGGRTFERQDLDTDRATGPGDVEFAPDGRAMVALSEMTLASDGSVASARLAASSSSDRGATWSKARLAQAPAAVVTTPNLAFAGAPPVIAFNAYADPPFGTDVFVTIATGDRTLP